MFKQEVLTINFLEEYNMYRGEIFTVYLTFDGLSYDISFVFVAQNFVISTCLRYVVIVYVFLRNRASRLRQKIIH